MAGIDRQGRDSVMTGWDTYINRYPLWSLHEYNGKKIGIAKFTGNSDDRQLFSDMLTAAEQSGTTQGYCLCFWDDQDGQQIPKGIEPPGSFTFNLKQSYSPAPMAGIGGPASGGDSFLIFLQNERNRLTDRVGELEQENEELREDLRAIEAEQAQASTGKNMGVIGQIGEAVKNPEFMNMVKDGIYILRKAFEKPAPTQTPAPQAMAGVTVDGQNTPTQRVNAALETLVIYYTAQAGDQAAGLDNFANDMELLARMTANPLDFNYAISKLRDNFKK
jgi:hypothetical protein